MIPKIDHSNSYTPPILPVEKTEWVPNVEENFLTLEAEKEVVMVQIANYTRMVVLRLLKDNDLLDVRTTKMVMEHKNPDDLCCAVSDFCAIDILHLDNFEVICEHPKPKFFAQILFRLHKENLFFDLLLALVSMHPNAELLWDLMRLLEKGGITLSQGILGITIHPEPKLLIEYLTFLLENDLPIEKYFNVAFSPVKLSFLLEFMKLLKKVDLLTEVNIDLTVDCPLVNLNGINFLTRLADHEILNDVNYKAILKDNDFESLECLVARLKKLRMLNLNTFSSVLKSKDRSKVYRAIERLRERNLSNETNFIGIANHPNPDYVAEAIILLHQHEILLPELIEFTFHHDSPEDFVRAIILLRNRELLTNEKRDLTFLHDKPIAFVEGMLLLLDHGKLSIENLEYIFDHSNPKRCAEAIIELFSDYNFTDEEQEEIIASSEPLDLLLAWRVLKKEQIFSPETKEATSDHEAPIEMAQAIVTLHSAKILNEENLRVISYNLNSRRSAKILVIMTEMNLLKDFKWRSRSYQKAILKLKKCNLLDHGALKWSQVDMPDAVLILEKSLNLENYQAIRNHAFPRRLANAIVAMKENRELLKYLVKHDDPDDLVKGLLQLKKNGSLLELFDWLTSVKRDVIAVAELLCMLSRGGVPLTDTNLKLVSNCSAKWSLQKGLRVLQFTEDCFQIAAVHKNPEAYCIAIKNLPALKDPNDRIRLHLANHPFPYDLVLTLQYLQQMKFFTETILEQVLNHSDTETLLRVLRYPNVTEIPLSEIWEKLVNHPDIRSYDNTIRYLLSRRIKGEYLKLALNHSNPKQLCVAVAELYKRSILTERSFIFLINHEDPCEALEYFPGGSDK